MRNWGIGMLLLVGVMVGAVSLYSASLTGVMNKMGLVGGDLRQAVDVNELARQLRMTAQTRDCGLWSVTKRIPYYWGLRGEGRIEAAGRLGQERIECGIKYIQAGNVERGAYTLVKGLYYLRNRYSELRSLVEQDKAKCELLGLYPYETWVEAYLVASQGNAHQVVLDIYKQMEIERVRVEELCIE